MRRLRIDIIDSSSRKRGQFSFSSSPVKVGRGRMNDLVLDFDFVSQLHGAISFSEDQAVFMDLGSRNGTVIDGAKAKKNRSVRLSASPRMQIGTLELAFSWEEADKGRVGSASASASGPSGSSAQAVFAPPAPASEGPASENAPRGSANMPKKTRVLDDSMLATLGAGANPTGPAAAPAPAAPKVPAPGAEGTAVSLPPARVAAPAAPDLPPAPFPTPFPSDPSPVGVDLSQAAPSLSFPWSVAESALPPGGAGAFGTAAAFGPAAALPFPISLPPLDDSRGVAAAKTGAMADAFARELVQLCVGISSVAEDLGLPAMTLPGPLGACDSSDEILQCLSEVRGPGLTGPQELARAFAYLFAHHVSVVGGLRECIDDLVLQASPRGVIEPARVASVAEGFRFSYRNIMAGQGFQPAPAYAPMPLPTVSAAGPGAGSAPELATMASYGQGPQTPLSGSRGQTSELPAVGPGEYDGHDEHNGVPRPSVHKLTNLEEDPDHPFFLSKPRVTIGRQNDTDLPLPFPAVSRVHAELTQDPQGGGWTISDLGSSNGTFLNGAQMQSARLKVGDIIQIGPIRLQFS